MVSDEEEGINKIYDTLDARTATFTKDSQAAAGTVLESWSKTGNALFGFLQPSTSGTSNAGAGSAFRERTNKLQLESDKQTIDERSAYEVNKEQETAKQVAELRAKQAVAIAEQWRQLYANIDAMAEHSEQGRLYQQIAESQRRVMQLRKENRITYDQAMAAIDRIRQRIAVVAEAGLMQPVTALYKANQLGIEQLQIAIDAIHNGAKDIAKVVEEAQANTEFTSSLDAGSLMQETNKRLANEAEAARKSYAEGKIDYAQYQAELTDIARRAEEARARLREQTVRDTMDSLVALVQVMGEHSRKMFEIGKALAMAQAIANAAVAIVRCYAELGPIYGTIAAVGVAAATAVQLHRIQDTKFQGGSSGASSGAAANIGSAGSQRQATPQTVIFQVRGGNMISVDQLQETFRDAKRRGIVFTDVRVESGR
jgi:hypothetical protein